VNFDFERHNADWLRAWTNKNVEQLISFYSSDCIYMDPQTTGGIVGHSALRRYLTDLFSATPPMRYIPDEIWQTHNGYCGRWYCIVGEAGDRGKLRGFDLVVLRDSKIILNEVYVHQLADAA
jgi:hypothetical protein